jgi:hypothetical protein
VPLDPAVVDAVIEALRGPFRLEVVYGEADPAPRVLEPHGVLLGRAAIWSRASPGGRRGR